MKKSDASSDSRAPLARFRRQRWFPTVFAVLVMVTLALVLNPRPQIKLPSLSTAGFDPAVAVLIQRTLDEVRHAPRSGAAWGKLGCVLLHYEFIEQSHEAFAKAEQLSPKEPRWPYLHALLLLGYDASTAVSKLERAVALCGDSPDMPRLRLAQFLAERGRYEDAEHHLNALLRSKIDHAPAFLGLARLHQARGRLPESTNMLHHCLDDPHTARSSHVLLAAVYRALGHATEAEAAARRSSDLPADASWPDPYWEEAVVWRVGRKAMIESAAALIDQAHFEDALAILAQITREYPTDDEGWYLMGWALNQLQRSELAERALREHLQRSPESPKGHAQLAVSLLSQKRYTEAVKVLEAGLRLKPTWRELHFNLGFACVQLGREDEAIRHFRNALARDPNYPASYTALAELLIRRGEQGEVGALLREVLKIDPGNARARSLLEKVGSEAR